MGPVTVTDVRLYRYALPLAGPLMLNGEAVTEREGVLVAVETSDGRTGWGEAAPLPGFSKESLDTVIRVLVREAERLVDAPAPATLPALAARTNALAPVPSARFGLEAALCAAAGIMPPRLRPHVAMNALLAGEDAVVVREAARVRESGYRCIKLKVGRGPAEAIVRRVAGVREALGPGIALRLDANRAWRFEEAVTLAGQLVPFGVAYVEEPLSDPDGLPDLIAHTALPVALDETVVERGRAVLKDVPGAAALVLKPTLLGMSPTLDLIAAAREAGVTPVLSAAYESGVGMRVLVALAAASAPAAPVGLDTYRRLSEDVFEARLPLTGPEVPVAGVLNAPVRLRGKLLTRLEWR